MKRIWEYMTLYDKILIISIIVISGFFMLSPLVNILAGGGAANIKENQVIVIQTSDGSQQRIPVIDTYKKEPIIIRVKGPIGTSIIEAHNGQVRMKEAPPADPEKICKKTGWINQPGPMIICVPNQIAIWIEMKGTDLDGVSW